MPDHHQPCDLLRDLRDVGVTPPRPEALQDRVSAMIAQEIDRERRRRGRGADGSSSRWSTVERFGGLRPRRRYARLAGVLGLVFSVLVVAVVVAVFVTVRDSSRSRTAGRRGSVELVYQAVPSSQAGAVTPAALNRTVQIIDARLAAFGIGGAHVSVSGANEVAVRFSAGGNAGRTAADLVAPARLSFFDWEADALTPSGRTVASLLPTGDQLALAISQGDGNAAPGDPGAGSIGLYQAVKLASTQRPAGSAANSQPGSQYYMFATGGSPACVEAAKFYGVAAAPARTHCLLSGPDSAEQAAIQGLPPGVSPSEGQLLVVPQGTVVLQAVPASFANPPKWADPTAQFYVLEDNVVLTGNDITNPKPSTDQSGTPDVSFNFTAKGQTEFHNVTAVIARRGTLVSSPDETLDQHFAAALDNVLITVPSIDYNTYPDGVTAADGAELTGPFTATSARNLAIELRTGPLPLNLALICGDIPGAASCHLPQVR